VQHVEDDEGRRVDRRFSARPDEARTYRGEVGRAVRGQAHKLAIEDELPAAGRRPKAAQLGERLGAVAPGARADGDVSGADLGLQTDPVPLDLGRPLASGRAAQGRGGQHRRHEARQVFAEARRQDPERRALGCVRRGSDPASTSAAANVPVSEPAVEIA
jgi:hypothetical protein